MDPSFFDVKNIVPKNMEQGSYSGTRCVWKGIYLVQKKEMDLEIHKILLKWNSKHSLQSWWTKNRPNWSNNGNL
jgi:hypothetical protein